jgi:hypothetical protein
MNQTDTSMKQQKSDATVARVDMKLEVDIIPVSDVERSKQFYRRLGWRLDTDVPRQTAFASSSSRPRAQHARSRSARE